MTTDKIKALAATLPAPEASAPRAQTVLGWTRLLAGKTASVSESDEVISYAAHQLPKPVCKALLNAAGLEFKPELLVGGGKRGRKPNVAVVGVPTEIQIQFPKGSAPGERSGTVRLTTPKGVANFAIVWDDAENARVCIGKDALSKLAKKSTVVVIDDKPAPKLAAKTK